MDLPSTREEYTQMALTYQFDPAVTGLYGVLVDEVEHETAEERNRAFWKFVHWIGRTAQDFPDLVEHHSENEDSVAIWIAGVFACVARLDRITDEYSENNRQQAEVLTGIFRYVKEKSRTRKTVD